MVHSAALAAVVEFCISDNVKSFDGRADEAAARGIVQLLACAHFLDMRVLQERARALCTTLLSERKSLACAIFDGKSSKSGGSQLSNSSVFLTSRDCSFKRGVTVRGAYRIDQARRARHCSEVSRGLPPFEVPHLILGTGSADGSHSRRRDDL